MAKPPPQIFTLTSAISLGAVATIGVVAYIGSKTLLPKNAKWQDRFTFIWVVSIIHPSNEIFPAFANSIVRKRHLTR
jgi:hypothetical protein